MFKQHWLGAVQFQWDAVAQPNNGLTLVFCALLLLFTLILVTFRRKLILIFRALFSQRHLSIIQREGKLLEDRISSFVLLFDIMTIATGLVMFCTVYIPQAMSKLPFIAYIGIFFALLFLAYILKLLCNELYANLFGRVKEHTSINQYKFIFMTDLSVAIFPLLVIIQYTGIRAFYYVIVGLLAALFAVWLYRLSKINSNNIHRFHFFLYFCTLEILPWLIFLKVLLVI
jgi:hypothetical protein